MPTTENLGSRILRTVIPFVLWFFVAAMISYFILPTGFLRSTNEVGDVTTEENFAILCAKFCPCNLFPAALLCIGCLVAVKCKNKNYPFAYLGLFLMFSINGMTLGTWSFTAVDEAAPPLFLRSTVKSYAQIRQRHL